MADTEVKLKLTAEDGLTPTMKNALDALSNLNVGVINLSAGFEIFKTVGEGVKVVYEKISEQVEKSIEEALAAEKANNRLTGALVASGNYSKEAAEKLNEYSESLETSVGANAESVKGMIAQGLQMGLSIEKSKQLEEASRKLAAATGTDVDTAFRKLQQSLTGHARALAMDIPMVKDMGTAQLKQGDAIDLVNKSLDAQYQLYQNSLPASIDKAKVAVDNVYKAFGNIIIQNPLVQKGLNEFINVMNMLAEGVKEVGAWVSDNMDLITSWGASFAKAAAVVGVLVGVVPAVTAAITGLGAAFAFLSGPVGLTILAVTALTIAFQKFPGLSDLVIGSLKVLASVFLELVTGPLQLFMYVLGKVVGIFKKDWGDALTNAQAAIDKFNVNLGVSGVKQAELGIETLKAGKAIETTATVHHDASTKMLTDQSNLARAAKETTQAFAGINIGTSKQREQLQAQAEGYKEDLQHFQQYYDAKMQLAVSREQAQQIALAKVRADALKGAAGGSAAASAGGQEIDAEIQKQSQLKAQRQIGLINEQEYNDALLASQQRAAQAQLKVATASSQALADALGQTPAGFAQKNALLSTQQEQEISQAREKAAALGATSAQQIALENQMRTAFYQQRLADEDRFQKQELDMANVHQQALADALGESPAGFQIRQQMLTNNFQIELQNKMLRAQQEGATQDQIDQMKIQANAQLLAQQEKQTEDYYSSQAEMQERAGNGWQAYLDRVHAAQTKEGTVMGTLHATQNSQYYKAEDGMLSNLATLRSSHSKTAFELGKKAAIAQATIHTFTAATEAYAALAGIPIVGPVLGAIAAAAAVAAGFVQIQNIQAQQFSPGGQADSGMDSVPGALSGKSFVLSAGERVIQPTANKQLTAFLDREDHASKGDTGSAGGRGNTYQITVNVTPGLSQADANKAADLMIEAIRSKSERGQKIVAAKGVY